jgi:predicted acylesterase/phospholipase RssA
VLLEKTKDGAIREYKGGQEFDMELTDGSLVNDIPSQGLAEIFNATFFIVDQVNPHIAPFFFNAQGSAGSPSGWRRRTGSWRGGFLLSFLELYLKEEMRKNLKLVCYC